MGTCHSKKSKKSIAPTTIPLEKKVFLSNNESIRSFLSYNETRQRSDDRNSFEPHDRRSDSSSEWSTRHLVSAASLGEFSSLVWLLVEETGNAFLDASLASTEIELFVIDNAYNSIVRAMQELQGISGMSGTDIRHVILGAIESQTLPKRDVRFRVDFPYLVFLNEESVVSRKWIKLINALTYCEQQLENIENCKKQIERVLEYFKPGNLTGKNDHKITRNKITLENAVIVAENLHSLLILMAGYCYQVQQKLEKDMK